jgi:C-terminal processing protease CtpA/Prc
MSICNSGGFYSARGFLLPLAFSAALTLSACGGGGGSDDSGGDDSGSCSVTSQKQFVLDVARDWYLFPELLPDNVDIDDFASASELLDYLTAEAREQGIDRYFSYVTTVQEDQANFQGQNAGFGFRLGLTSDERLFLLEVFETAPAGEAGFNRGTEIVEIDDGNGYRSISEWLAIDPDLEQALGPSEAGVERGFRYVLRGENELLETEVVKAEYVLNPIPSQDIGVFALSGTPGVGYVNFRSFVETDDSEADLAAAFNTFRTQGITDFIIDLRYNGGGLVSVEEAFADLLGGALNTELAHVIEFNEAHSDNNSSKYFDSRPESVSPVRIAYITTGNSASASELLINTMDPYVSVAVVGDETYGKPVGQSGFSQDGCDTLLRLVTFRTVNSEGEGDYYAGLSESVDFACAAFDDIAYDFADTREDSIATAMDWLATGSCPQGSISAKALSETAGGLRLLNPEQSTLASAINPGTY